METVDPLQSSHSTGDATPLAGIARACAEGLNYRAVWKGAFRRYDSQGDLIEALPSRITLSFDPSLDEPYAQTNCYTMPDGRTETVESTGRWENGKLLFRNENVTGISADLSPEQDPLQRSAMLHLSYQNGSDITMYEIITNAPDGNSRLRVAQYDHQGSLIRRTLIDEVKVEETFTPHASRPTSKNA